VRGVRGEMEGRNGEVSGGLMQSLKALCFYLLQGVTSSKGRREGGRQTGKIQEAISTERKKEEKKRKKSLDLRRMEGGQEREKERERERGR
jgi:hypothetical protein